MEVNKMTNEELLNEYLHWHSFAEAYGQESDMLKSQEHRAELLRRLEHGQGAQPDPTVHNALTLAKKLLWYLAQHAPGYDWNADAKYFTLKISQCSEWLDKALEIVSPELGPLAAPPEQPQGGGEPIQGRQSPLDIVGNAKENGIHVDDPESAGLADRGEGQTSAAVVSQTVCSAVVNRTMCTAEATSQWPFQVADPAQGQMSAREWTKLPQNNVGLPEHRSNDCGSHLLDAQCLRCRIETVMEAFARSQGEEKNG